MVINAPVKSGMGVSGYGKGSLGRFGAGNTVEYDAKGFTMSSRALFEANRGADRPGSVVPGRLIRRA